MMEVMSSPSDCMAAVRRKCSGQRTQTQLVAYIESKQRTREVLNRPDTSRLYEIEIDS
jgi:hypothetical protein